MSRSEPDREQTVEQYLGRASYKLRIAEYHLAEFERLQDELTGRDFLPPSGESFFPVQAHADGVVMQLAAAFDAFACAIAHHYEIGSPDKADFVGNNEQLARSADGELADALRSIKDSPEHRELTDYRNLAAHRGVLGEMVRATEGPDGRDEVRVLLPLWLPEHFPDYPEAYVWPILHRYIDWARPALDLLRRAAAATWEGRDHIGEASVQKQTTGRVVFQGSKLKTTITRAIDVSAEGLAPSFGEWKVWHSLGSHNFGSGDTDPPAWFLRRGDEPVLRKDSAGLQIEELSAWVSDATGPDAAKAILRHYRPRFIHGTAFGTLLIPGHS